MESFDRSGFAALTDLKTTTCISLFTELEKLQDNFLENQHKFRSADYKWPSDALHWWSRCWEYPFVMHHLKKCKSDKRRLNVADVGCGVTFFPFAVATENFAVTAVDVDPVVQKDMLKAIEFYPCNPGSVGFSLSEGNKFRLEDNSQELVYCISVIEHIEDTSQILSEIHRVLKPGGIFIMTIDIDIEGNGSIGPEKFYDIMLHIDSKFEKQYSNTSVHSQDMLTSECGPYPMTIPRSLKQKIKEIITFQKAVKSVLGCYGAVYKKP